MAHFAQLDDSNTVIRVIVVDNNDIADDLGIEQESLGVAFCQSLLGADTNWIQTSYNSTFRGTFAGTGFVYDPVSDTFIEPADHSLS